MLNIRTIATCLALACTPTAAHAASLVGYWYGQGYQPLIHEVSQQIIHHGEDGSFEIHFRVYKNCILTYDQHEAGMWKLSGPNSYRVVTTSVRGAALLRPAIDDYRFEELTEQHVRYIHLATSVEYTTESTKSSPFLTAHRSARQAAVSPATRYPDRLPRRLRTATDRGAQAITGTTSSSLCTAVNRS